MIAADIGVRHSVGEQGDVTRANGTFVMCMRARVYTVLVVIFINI